MKLTAFHWMCSCSCSCNCSWSLCQPPNNDECDRNNHFCIQVKGDVKLKKIQTTYSTRKRVYSVIFFASECCLIPSFPSKMPYITKKSRISLMLALIYGSTAAQCLIHSKYQMYIYVPIWVQQRPTCRTSYIHTVPTRPQVNKNKETEIHIMWKLKAQQQQLQKNPKYRNAGLKVAEIFALLFKKIQDDGTAARETIGKK